MYEVHIALVYGVYVSLGSLVPVQKMNIYLFLVVNTIYSTFFHCICALHIQKSGALVLLRVIILSFFLPFCDIFSSYYSFNIFLC
jgi:hypothetical protein